MSAPITIIIADDHALFIEGLKQLLQAEQDISILDVANDGKELLTILQKQLPQMVLLDINMPGINGLETARYIKQSYNSVKIIMLSTYNEDHLVEKAKEYGVNGYLLKNCNKEELLQTIRLVALGQSCFPYRLSKTINEFNSADPFLKQFNLSKREMEIIGLIKKGNTNRQIADFLSLSIYTIETHRKNIMQKLQLNSPAALMKFILEHQL
jgi:two-component system nitrate/nitrite response regulator NarL